MDEFFGWINFFSFSMALHRLDEAGEWIVG